LPICSTIEEKMMMDPVDKTVADEERGVEPGSLGNGGGGGDAPQLRVEIDVDDRDLYLDVENGRAGTSSGSGGPSSPASNRSNSVPALHDQDRDSLLDRSPSHAQGRWGTMGTRRIRFASQRSDVNENELRGIVATPLDLGTAKPMGAGERFLRNIQNEVGEIDAPRQKLFRRCGTVNEGEGPAQDEQGPAAPRVYRLQATRGARDVGCLRVSRVQHRAWHVMRSSLIAS